MINLEVLALVYVPLLEVKRSDYNQTLSDTLVFRLTVLAYSGKVDSFPSLTVGLFIYGGRPPVCAARRSVGGCEEQHTVMELFSISRNQSRDGGDCVG